MLLPSRRIARRRLASQLPARLLLCAIFAAVCTSLQGRVISYADLDEEIDYLDSVIEKQKVSHIKQSTKLVSASQVEGRKHQDTSKHKQRNQSHPAAEVLPTPTTATSPPVSVLPNILSPKPRATGVEGKGSPFAVPASNKDGVIVILISLCILVGTVAVILAAVCYTRLLKESHLAQKVDYPAFGGGAKDTTVASATSIGDKTLAQSAQMYHYQHQKQQMLSMEKHKPEQKVADSEVTTDEEEVGGDFTVYECPGLAPTGEMEVKNPLFDDSTLHHQENHK
ncbi:neural proliferation differentiation and control protein 1-like isoform X2 [Lampris incognitus]|uniref:neural proliferation differentiation and control protein 1-like isoform X2 n=1 Tax=Lampris incognitus TaxID=2546036 RepID=UPI0024B4F5E5|nr:neural proliferation differentiation and control protein 1-like isoform X2 [Lampris incognitus]